MDCIYVVYSCKLKLMINTLQNQSTVAFCVLAMQKNEAAWEKTANSLKLTLSHDDIVKHNSRIIYH